MDQNELLQLMHVVLDRTATDAERAALERALAADPAARAEFERQERLFGALAAMPAEPPAGFVDDVMAALQRNKASTSPSHQPFSQSGVIAPMGSDIRVRAPSKPITARTPSGPIRGRQDMSKRGLWIIGGVAAAVMALFVGNAIDFPASGDKATGTIVPAERVRNAQPGAADVKIAPPGSERRPSPPVPLATGDGSAPASGLNANAAGQNAAGLDAASRLQSSAGMDAASRTQNSAGMDAAGRTQNSAGMDAAGRTQNSAGMDAAGRTQNSAGMDAASRSQNSNAAGMDARYKK